MSLPKPPEDLELKNIIDKLANFVARNGTEFEEMTKQKQKDNPKFSFLFSGEFFNYYQYRVSTEQSIIKQQQQQHQQQFLSMQPPTQQQQQQNLVQQVLNQQSVKSAPWQQAPPLSQQQQQQPINPALNNQSNLREQLEQMKINAKEQILQSENNLNAQYQNLMQEQQSRLEEALLQAKKDQLLNMSMECEISLEEIEKIVQPIIESCTKDAISNGKAWILSHFKSQKHGEFIAHYILERIIDKDSTFDLRLHLIYLINDLLHHCTRKNVKDLKDIIENVSVIPSFCLSFMAAHEEGKAKLTKLLTLWENNKYFTAGTIEQMKDPSTGIASYQAFLLNEHSAVVADVSMATNNNFMMLQQQHQEFVSHLNNQILALEQQLQQQQQQFQQQPNNNNSNNNNDHMDQYGHQPPHHLLHQPPMQQPHPNFLPPPFNHQMPPGFPMPPFNPDFPSSNQPPLHLPDLSKPPPGFPGAPMGFCPPPNLPPPMFKPEVDLVPTIPYFDLPAGLMAPLVKLGDCEYKSLDPRNIRLPPPMPPTERLLAAVEAFYSPPSHDRPRDADGWEKLSLFEFYKAKNQAKSNKIETEADKVANKFGVDLNNTNNNNNNNINNNNNNNVNNTIMMNNNNNNNSNGIVRGHFNDTKVSAYSRSPSPDRRRRSRRSRSYSGSSSGSRSRSGSRSYSRSRSRSRSPDQYQDMFYPSVNKNDRLSESNKGHQLMKKMGWGGGALGNTGDGIIDPIDHADIRDKQDQFKGLGMSLNDPFENFRKNKSSGFNVRMRERADSRSTRKGSPR